MAWISWESIITSLMRNLPTFSHWVSYHYYSCCTTWLLLIIPTVLHPYYKLDYIRLAWGSEREQEEEQAAGNHEAKNWQDEALKVLERMVCISAQFAYQATKLTTNIYRLNSIGRPVPKVHNWMGHHAWQQRKPVTQSCLISTDIANRYLRLGLLLRHGGQRCDATSRKLRRMSERTPILWIGGR